MSRHAALIATWSHPVPGREAAALKAFQNSQSFWQRLADEGKCSKPLVWMKADASSGISIVEGDAEALNAIIESDEYEKVNDEANLVVQDFKRSLYHGGSSDEVGHIMKNWRAAAEELGIV
ncbi:hypothetical protein [Georgenia wangjunii]|uniref:hypothetical protein n=1 Tax=Georgenia wangjunii TaxID=3117730 RepID=UPI002F264BDB